MLTGREYDNGQMVWNVVDGLRGEDRSGDSSDSEYTQTGNHSRGASFASSASGASAANLRSAPTKIAQLRPKTNVSCGFSMLPLTFSCTLHLQTMLRI